MDTNRPDVFGDLDGAVLVGAFIQDSLVRFYFRTKDGGVVRVKVVADAGGVYLKKDVLGGDGDGSD